MYNTESEVTRGYHAHQNLEQVLVCVHGSCKILLDDGYNKEVINLDSPNMGLHIGSNLWREMFEFSDGTVLMVMASEYYDEEDYVRDYEEFLELDRR